MNKSIVITFGRFQPPTIGHELVFNKIKTLSEELVADHAIFVSKSTDKKKNPLTLEDKLSILMDLFPNHEFVGCKPQYRTLVEVVKMLNPLYTDITLVFGDDRVETFQNLLNKYNGVEFNYKSINVVSAGVRSSNLAGVQGISGTIMREAALDNDFDKFYQGLPTLTSVTKAKEIMRKIQAGLASPVKENLLRALVKPTRISEDHADTEVSMAKKDAVQHYPGLEPDAAFEKFIVRSVKHAKEDDALQNSEISRLKQEIEDIKSKIEGSRSAESIDASQMSAPSKPENTPINGGHFELNELSNDTLGQYKTAAGKASSAADKRGDTATANKRYSGIIKATKKEFDNDAKTTKQVQELSTGAYKTAADALRNPANIKTRPLRKLAKDARMVKIADKKANASKPTLENILGENVENMLPDEIIKKVAQHTNKPIPELIALWKQVTQYAMKMYKNDPTAAGFRSFLLSQFTNRAMSENMDEDMMDEGWKSTLAGAALGAAAMFGGGGAHAGGVNVDNPAGFSADQQISMNQKANDQASRKLAGFNTEYLQSVVDGSNPRPLVSVDAAKAELNARANGAQQAQPASQPAASTGYSIEFLQKAADPNRTGRFMISVEKAQQLLNQAQGVRESKILTINEDIEKTMAKLVAILESKNK